MELTRSDIGFGRVILDEVGVTRRGLFRTRSLAEILRRLRDRLGERARTQLKIRGAASFGPLELARHAVQWGTHPPLAHDAVEAIELFDGWPARLRVMARGKAWPYAHAPSGHVPNVVTALELAEELGYRVRGTRMLAPILP